MIEITKLIESLKDKRKIFHSEDDLKLSFGMEILENHSDCQVRLERPVEIQMIDGNGNPNKTRAPIDIIITENNGNLIPIELKYKTKKVELKDKNEQYKLTGHGAFDIARFSFRKDIFRIEQYLTTHKNSQTGYVLILTNDNSYFDIDTSKKENFDKFFSFHNGAVIQKEDKGWNYSKINREKYEFKDNCWWYKAKKEKHWTCRKELFYKLNLKTDYKVDWKLYSSFQETTFRYCLIEINKNNFK